MRGLLGDTNATRADAGTPLMWAGLFHLTTLNAVIGVVEGVALALCFRARSRRTVVWMIPANYFSTVVGALLLGPTWVLLDHLVPGKVPLFKAPVMLWSMLGASWAFTILLEWPFCIGALWNARHGWRITLLGSVLAQMLSYAGLVPYYMSASPITFLTQTHIEHNLAFVGNPTATVFYIGNDGDVWRVPMNGTARTKVCDLGAHDAHTALYEVKSGEGVDICDVRVGGDDRKPDRRLVGRLIVKAAGLGWAADDVAIGQHHRESMAQTDSRPPGQRSYEFSPILGKMSPF